MSFQQQQGIMYTNRNNVYQNEARQMPWADNPSQPRSHEFPGTALGVALNRIEPANAFSGGRAEAQMREVNRAFRAKACPALDAGWIPVRIAIKFTQIA